MKKGCLLFLLLYLVASAIEYRLFDKYHPKVSPFVGLGVALFVVACIGQLHGIYVALRLKRLLAKQPSDWKDGELIGVSGRLTATRDPLTAPTSLQRAAIYEYEVKRMVVSGSGKNRSTSYPIDYMGFGMAPCTIQGPRGALKLVGFPILSHFPMQKFHEPKDLERTYAYLQTANLTPKATSFKDGLKQLSELFKDEDGEVILDLRSPTAITEVKRSSDVSSDAVSPVDETPTRDFFGVGYFIEEHVIQNGTIVTAVGTYRHQPARIDVGGIFDTLAHAVYPGEGSAVARKNLTKAVIGSVIFTAITAIGHYYLFRDVPNFSVW